MCSTPVGVTDFCTLRPVRHPDPIQRCSTPVGVTAFCTLVATAEPPGQPQVLNACRRHCLQHSVLSKPTRKKRTVFNASRRRCLLHTEIQTSTNNCHGCSTPLGVAAFCPAASFAPGRRPAGAQRLSASLPSAPLLSEALGTMSLPSPPFTRRLSATLLVITSGLILAQLGAEPRVVRPLTLRSSIFGIVTEP